jgi:hypothetical protein
MSDQTNHEQPPTGNGGETARPDVLEPAPEDPSERYRFGAEDGKTNKVLLYKFKPDSWWRARGRKEEETTKAPV